MSDTENIDPNWVGENAIYREHIIDHYKNPRNLGVLRQWTHHAREINPVCGDRIEIFVCVEKEKIKEVKFQGKGCAISIAATSLLTEYIHGKKIVDLKKINKEKIIEMLGINLGIVRLKCGLLGLNTLKKCMNGGNNESISLCQ